MGRPKGARAEQPREGSLARVIVHVYDNRAPRDLAHVRELVNLAIGEPAFINEGAPLEPVKHVAAIIYALDRWRPEWRRTLRTRGKT